MCQPVQTWYFLWYFSYLYCDLYCFLTFAILDFLFSPPYYFYYLRQGGYVFGSIGLFVCLCVCLQENWKSYEQILIKFAGDVRGGIRNKWLDFGDVLADTDEMRVLAPLGGGLRSPSASSICMLLVWNMFYPAYFPLLCVWSSLNDSTWWSLHLFDRRVSPPMKWTGEAARSVVWDVTSTQEHGRSRAQDREQNRETQAWRWLKTLTRRRTQRRTWGRDQSGWWSAKRSVRTRTETTKESARDRSHTWFKWTAR